ncbi:hypothetical protein KKF86_05310 [bacterium]|nr:hypothetical protein [bacterium]
MKKFITAFMIVLSVLLSQETSYGDAFLNIGASSRSVGLGRSVVALPQNVGGYLINPAATAFLSNNTFTGMYVNQFELAEYYTLGFSHPTKNGYQWGIHGLNLSVNDIFERPEVKNITDLESRRDSIRALVARGFNSFNTRESALIINLSKSVEYNLDLGWRFAEIPLKIPIGINVKLLQKDLYKVDGTGIGIDIGGMVLLDLKQIFLYDWLNELAFGMSLNNIVNTRMYWSSGKRDDIPMQLITGIGYSQTFNHLPIKYKLLLQKNSLYSNETQYGAELTLFDVVNVRGGLNYGYLQGGIGLTFGNLNYSIDLDYSFSNHDLGNVHRIGGTIYL